MSWIHRNAKAGAVLSKGLAYSCRVHRGLSFPELKERFFAYLGSICQQFRKCLALFVDLFDLFL